MYKPFIPMSLLGCVFVNLFLGVGSVSATQVGIAHCEVNAPTLRKARNEFVLLCGSTPRDCDPSPSGWTCSSNVIGQSAPNFPPSDETSGVTTLCTASGSTLAAAKRAYAQQCDLPRRDCDPIAGSWVCSSDVIGQSAPPLAESGSTPVTPVTPVSPDSPIVDGLSVVAQWNELALAGARATGAKPTVVGWRLFMVSTAMFDALAVYSDHSIPYALSESDRRPANEQTAHNKQAAVSQAAYQMLAKLFPNFEQDNGYFARYLNDLGYQPHSNADNTPAGLGYRAFKTLLDARSNDGSNFQNDFEPITSSFFPTQYEPVNSPDPISEVGIFGDDFDPNRWQPLRVPNGTLLDDLGIAAVDNLNLNSFGDQEFLSPHWGAVEPFALIVGSQFRPVPPPLLGSHEPYTDAKGVISTNDEAYRRQIAEVIQFSADLDDRGKVIAEFWADGPRTESPPGHWNQLAHGLIERDNLSLDESVHLFFALNGALLDAAIATWETKRFYDYIRPASAIRFLNQDQMIYAWGGPNQGTQLIDGVDWRPYQLTTFVTPPFPEYVSGHSTFSRASAEVLTLLSGSGLFYDGVTTTIQDVNSDGLQDFFGEHIQQAGTFFIEEGPAEDVVLRWNTFREAADEAGISRLFGGIHIQDGDLRGRELGRIIGVQAYEHALSYIDGTLND